MKIAYVTTYDASDIHSWGGSGYYISQTLKLSGFRIEYIGNLREKANTFFRAKTLIYRKLLRKNYLRDREPLILTSYAKQVEKALLRINPDVVFSPGTIPIAYLQTNKPIVFWTDATFAGMADYYPGFSNLCRESVRNGHRMEQEALSRCSLAIYTSEWAAKTAVDNYDVDPRKVKVVSFGANVSCNRTSRDVKDIITRKDLKVCKLLFIGVDWVRKGGDIALRTAQMLNNQGIPTELHIVGCAPPFDVPCFVTLHGFISKSTKEGRKQLNALWTESHFLILPSRADCLPMVLAEAGASGVPSLATNVGGIPMTIRDGKNGQLFAVEDGAKQYSDYITRVMSSKEQYQQLAMSSFREYIDRLTWPLAGEKVCELIHRFCY